MGGGLWVVKSGAAWFYECVNTLPYMKTRIDISGRGISVSYKIAPERAAGMLNRWNSCALSNLP